MTGFGNHAASDWPHPRAIAERLLLGALKQQDSALEAAEAGERADYLAQASRDLSMSLDEDAARHTVRQLRLPRTGSWSIVDVVESDGAIHRLPIVYADTSKHTLIRALEGQWVHDPTDVDISGIGHAEPPDFTRDPGAALRDAFHSKKTAAILNEIGFGALLVVPLIVRARIQGAMTFVSRSGDLPFTPDEILLARDLAARSAMALENARLYREADASRQTAEAANRAKSSFLRSISHELRTPLSAIGGYTELIDMGIQGPVTEAQRTSLARIKVSQEHLLRLITEVLTFVGVESGQTQYTSEKVSIRQILVDVTDMLAGAAIEKGLTLEPPGSDPDVTAWADASRVRQILVNLIMNAVKYTPRLGTVAVAWGTNADQSVVSVSDNGPGIPAARLESIFEPFYQLSAGIADRQGGVGLGLAISRDLARAMRGDVTVESRVGVGSRFTLTLPSPRLELVTG